MLKYKVLVTDMQGMWNVKANVVIVATGTISKSFGQYLSDIPGKHEIKELQE
jgi:hypothetical protein